MAKLIGEYERTLAAEASRRGWMELSAATYTMP
jgi:hypothetical protein